MDEVCHEECLTPRAAAAFACKASSADMGEMQEVVSSVRGAIADLQASMQAMRADNQALRIKHRSLEQENGRLRRTIEETEYVQLWDAFDTVEEHYRQLELSKACSFDIEQLATDVKASINLAGGDGRDADFAAGVPMRRLSLAEMSPEKPAFGKLTLPLTGASPCSSPHSSPVCRDISSPKASPRMPRPMTDAPFLNGAFSDREISKPLDRAPRW